MAEDGPVDVRLDRAVPIDGIPMLSPSELRSMLVSALGSGCRLAALFGWPGRDESTRILAVLADPSTGLVRLASTRAGRVWEALTPDLPQAHLFERELAEQWGVSLVGHPWPKPLRFHPAFGAGASSGEGGFGEERPSPGVTEFFQVAGDEVHEVAVGPIHAGVIEPGHFRFQCHGETVLHLEMAHGYQHRGIEPSLVGGPGRRTVHVMETVAGDTTVGHTTAYCQLIEGAGGCDVPPRAMAWRAIALELERVANHTGDLGALAGDVGFLPTASFCGRLRGDVLNMTAALCGSRFGRGFVRPGGVSFDLDPAAMDNLRRGLDIAEREIRAAVDVMWESSGLYARFERTGTVSPELARDLGLVGPPARACGLPVDARSQFPTGFFRFAQIPVSEAGSGDVLGRALVRWLEIQRSITFLRGALASLPAGPVRSESPSALAPETCVATCVEGWRGEIWHVAITDVEGRLGRYKIVDPSFRNWPGVAAAMRGQAISDFPLCNKSFNLSYCGFDL